MHELEKGRTDADKLENYRFPATSHCSRYHYRRGSQPLGWIAARGNHSRFGGRHDTKEGLTHVIFSIMFAVLFAVCGLITGISSDSRVSRALLMWSIVGLYGGFWAVFTALLHANS